MGCCTGSQLWLHVKLPQEDLEVQIPQPHLRPIKSESPGWDPVGTEKHWLYWNFEVRGKKVWVEDSVPLPITTLP